MKNHLIKLSDITRYITSVLGIVIIGSLIFYAYLPVVSGVKITNVRIDGDDIIVDAEFFKNRGCMFKSLQWYDANNERHLIEFSPPEEGVILSRPTGKQVAKNWRIKNIDTLKGSYAIATHDCFGVNKQTPFFNMEKSQNVRTR